MIKTLLSSVVRIRYLATIFIACLLICSNVNAQTYTKGPVTGGGSNGFPFTQSSTKTQFLYTAADFNAIPIAGNITRIYFRSAVANSSGTYTNFTIRMGQTSLTSFPNSTYITGLSTVYTNSSLVLSGLTSWFPIDLTTPFTFDNSQSLVVEIVFTAKPTGGFNCNNTTASNTRRLNSTTTTATTGSTSGIYADFGMDISPINCTTPPTPGSTVQSHTPVVCSGDQVTFSLIGNSYGTAQTYRWESGPSATGPWTPIGSVQSIPSYTFPAPASSTYYHCAVTCSTQVAYSPAELLFVQPPLNGTYTINASQPASSTNFVSIADAIAAMQCGITGPVVFNIDSASGPYNAQLTIPVINGSSATNTITFNGNGAVVQTQPNSTNRQVIRINDADNIILDRLNIKSTDATYGWGVHIANNSNNITVSNCKIDLSTIASITSLGSNTAGIVVANSTSSVTTGGINSNLKFLNNTIIGGTYGIICTGLSTNIHTGNQITGNTITDCWATGIDVDYQDSTIIANNNISRPTRTDITTNTFSGIELDAGNRKCIIRNNLIHDTHLSTAATQTGTTHGIYFNNCDATAGLENLVYNNILYNLNSAGGTIYGIYNSGSDGAYYYHNTVTISNPNATAGTTRGFYQATVASNIKFFDNIVHITRGGSGEKVCIYIGTVTSGILADYNVYYINSTSGTNFVGRSTTTFATLPDWQAANSNAYDQHSVYADPQFADATLADFTPEASSVENAGTYVGINTDINGNTRSTTTPDPGAIEFELTGTDAAISWVSPLNPLTSGLTTITVRIDNVQVQTITSLNLSYSDGGGIVTQTFNGLNITSGNFQNLTFTVPYDLQVSTTIKAYVNTVNGLADASALNDTVSYTLCIPLPGGVYTINKNIPTGAGNYNSFTDAAYALACGIAGPVVFNVVPGTGPYAEQIAIPAMAGTSATNTVTFNGNMEIMNPSISNSGDRGIIKLNGADYVTIDSITFQTPGTYGIGVLLTNNADYNTVSNSVFELDSISAAANHAAIAITSTTASITATGANACDSNTFSNNFIHGGNIGIAVVGLAASPIHGNKVINNTIIDVYTQSVYVAGTNNTLVEGNNIYRRSSRPSLGLTYGIYFTTASTNARILRNRIHDPLGGNLSKDVDVTGILMTGADATQGNENLIANNLIYNFKGIGERSGIYVLTSDHLKFFHNTVVIDDPASSADFSRGFRISGASLPSDSVQVRNNIFYINRGGAGEQTLLWMEDSASLVFSNNNAFFLGASGTTKYVAQRTSTLKYTTLSAWQASGGQQFDQQSKYFDPLFASPATGDFTPGELQLDAIGDSLGIYTDLNLAARDSSQPDPGAIEFTVLSNVDLSVSNLVSPVQGACNTETEQVTVQVKNVGGTVNFANNAATVTCIINGPVSTTLTGTLTGQLAPNATTNLTLNGTFDMSQNGTYTFKVYVSCSGDTVHTNDTLALQTRVRAAIVPGIVTTPDSGLCNTGSAVLSLSGNAGGIIQWQESASSGGPWTNIGSAQNTYATPVLTSTKYYRAELTCLSEVAHSNIQAVTVNNPQLLSTTGASFCGTASVLLQSTTSAGATTNWYAASANGDPVFSGNNFQTPVLNATTTYYASAVSGSSRETVPSPVASGSSSNINTWGLRFVVNSPVRINSVDVFVSSTTPGASTLQVIISTLSNVVVYSGPVYNFTSSNALVQHTIPVNAILNSGLYKMTYSATNISGLLRNSSGVTFPYISSGNKLRITSAATSTDSLSGSYYYFYNWQISTACETSRTAVTATQAGTPPAINAFASVQNICSGASTQLIATSTNPGYSYIWTPGNMNGDTVIVSPSANTSYTVTATDTSGGVLNGCSLISQVSVGVLPSSLTLTSVPASLCYPGGVATLSISPSTGYPAGSIEWSSSPDNVTYTVIPSATSATYVTPNITSSVYYKVKIKNSAGVSCNESIYHLDIINPLVNSVTPGSRCGYGPVQLQATVSAGSTAIWYDAPVEGGRIGTGNTVNTPNINASKTYYVSAASGFSEQTTAKSGLSADPSTNSGTTYYGLVFDVYSEVNIDSVTVYPVSSNGSTGTVTVEIIDGNGNVMHSKTVNAAGYPATAMQPLIVPLGFHVMPGTNYKMRHSHAGISSLGMDGSTNAPNGNWGYPYVVPGVLSINHSTLSAPPANTARKDLYYYFYNWKISTGCQGQRTAVQATVTPAPSLNISVNDNVLCKGESATISVNSANDPNYSYAWNTGFNGASSNVTPLNSFRYFILATDTTNGPNAGCADTISQYVTVNPVPDAPSVGQSPLLVCDGVPVTLTATQTGTLLWSNGATTSSITVNPAPGSHTYTVTATNNFSCTSSTAYSFTAAITPDPVVTPTSDTVLCSGSVIKLAVADTEYYQGGYPAGTVVNWINIVSGLTPQDSITSDNGTTYQAQVVLPGGCQATSSVRHVLTRSVTTTPVLSEPTCGQINGKIVTSVNGGSAPYRYIWKQGSTVLRDVTTNNPKDSIYGLAPGNYTLEVADSVPYGCTSGVIPYVLNASVPVDAAISVSANISCNGEANGVLTASYTGGTGSVTYLWSNGSNSNSISNLVAGTYTVTVTDAAGCSDIETQTLTQPAAITAVFTTTEPECPGGTGSISAVVSGGTTAYQIMEWYDSALNGPFASGPVYNNVTPGDYILYVLDANSCEGILSVTLNDADASHATLNMKAFMQGYYIGNSTMNSVLFNQGVSSDMTKCDTVTVELRDPLSPTTTVHTAKMLLNVNGQGTHVFPASAVGQSYYIVVSHRGSIQTWSALPVTFCSTVTYDFSSAASKAYGSNMMQVEPGVWAFYAGDINQDTFLGVDDVTIVDNANLAGIYDGTYVATDVNGDGFLGVDDVTIVDNNNLGGVISIAP